MTILNRVCWAILVLLWMTVIYVFSDQPNSNEATEELFGGFNYWVRKGAHMTEYAILFYLLLGFCSSIRSSKFLSSRIVPRLSLDCLRSSRIRFANSLEFVFLPFLISVLYACTDEWHQSFVPGRSAVFSDVLIDSAGVFLAAIVVVIAGYLWKKT